MTDHDIYDRLPIVAQSCRDFGSDNRYYNVQEGVSCFACKNWNGAKCVRKKYDSVMVRLDE